MLRIAGATILAVSTAASPALAQYYAPPLGYVPGYRPQPLPVPQSGPTLNQYYQNHLSTLPRNPPPVQVMPPNAFGSTIR